MIQNTDRCFSCIALLYTNYISHCSRNRFNFLLVQKWISILFLNYCRKKIILCLNLFSLVLLQTTKYLSLGFLIWPQSVSSIYLSVKKEFYKSKTIRWYIGVHQNYQWPETTSLEERVISTRLVTSPLPIMCFLFLISSRE